MKGPTQSRPSKASLVARGLAAKPVKGKRNISLKAKKVPDAKPGYSLYSTDSEDQASSVGRGLDRCAALLTNILDSDSKDSRKIKAVENKQVNKARGRSVSMTSSTKSVPAKGKASIKSKPIVIPTASHKDQGPSTLYNDRLVASTPLLNSEERKRQHHLLEREQELTRQIQQLRQHFELLQQQKSPEIQEQQKLALQDSMLNELDDYQQTESQNAIQQISPKNPAPAQNVSDVKAYSSNRGTPGARRSLDFSHSHENQENEMRTESGIEGQQGKSNVNRRDKLEHFQQLSMAQPKSRDNSSGRPKKQVRLVSPDLDEVYEPSSSWSTRSKSKSSSLSKPALTPKSRRSFSPVAAENQVRTLQYLTRELREVIGRSDDLEVNRLLMEIDQTCSILPYTYTTRSSGDDVLDEQSDVVHQLKLENAQLRGNLQIADEKSQEQEDLILKYENMQCGKTSISFELAACRSENASLQKQLQEERESKGKLLRDIENLEQVVTGLKEDKKRFIQILENKEQNHSKSRRSGQQEILRMSNEIKQLKAELESGKLSLEAARKESVILNLSLKQKDTEIERLDQLSRSLQQSMHRVLGDIQTYQPNSISKDGAIPSTDLVGKPLIEQDPLRSIQTFTRSKNLQSLGINTTTKPRDINIDVTQGYRPTRLDYDPPIFDTHSEDEPLANRPSFEVFQKKSPLSSYGEYQNSNITTNERNTNKTPQMSADGPVYFSPKASLGPGTWTAGDSANLSPQYKNKSAELSSLSSRDEEEFQRDLESLDAEIARIQRSLRETAMRN